MSLKKVSSSLLATNKMSGPPTTVNILQANTYEVLVVGGGAGGVSHPSGPELGTPAGGGGGAGGVYYSKSSYYTNGLSLTILVGAGGSANSNGSNSGIYTTFNPTANVGNTFVWVRGGGKGGLKPASIAYIPPCSGGCGGGANVDQYDSFNPFLAGGAGTTGMGNQGGNSYGTTGGPRWGAGGGGAGSAGGVPHIGAGGAGIVTPISGVPLEYARGGAGSNGPGANGTANTGGGCSSGGTTGGSGTVIIRISSSANVLTTGSPTINVLSDGTTSYRYSGSGTFVI